MNSPIAQECRRGVIGVIADGPRLLMIKRADGIFLGGAWCFPGGGIEKGETSADALIRELREELGLSVQPGRSVWSWTREDGRLHLEWWTAHIVAGLLTPDPREVAEARWFLVGEIRRLSNVLPNNLVFLDVAETSGLFGDCGQNPI